MTRKKTLLSYTFLFLIFPSIAFSQVGIGTVIPKSSLDIAVSDADNPSPTDGILIPKLNDFPAVNPGPDQNGMMVFLTIPSGTYSIGFHYWDTPQDKWIPIGAEEWKDGTNASGDPLIYASQAKLSGTDVVITDDGRVGFGTEDPVERFEFKGPGDNDFQITSANTNPPNFILYNTGGTLEAPDVLATDGEIGSFIVKTHDGNGIRETGGFRFYMDGTATAGSTPSKFVINTTPTGSTNQQQRIIVRSTGNVGIGDPNPTAKLDVNGTARVRYLTAGAVYSDANGNLTNTPIAMGPQIVAAGLVQANGTAIKISGATVTRVDIGDYQITFDTARPTSNYIVNLTNIDCGGNCGGNTYDDPGITYYNRTTTGFNVNIGDSDNGTTAKVDIDLEFSFTVVDF